MKTLVITGGSRGIGWSIAETFAKQGYKVLAGGRKAPSGKHENIRFFEMDVRNAADHEKMVKAAIDWTGQLDVSIQCAGVSQWRPIQDVDQAFWDLIMRTNAEGSYWGMQAAAKVLKSGGSIIAISSLAGKRGSANNSVYCASKFAINGMTQALAKELGPRGIRVNAVCPVYVETDTIIESLKDKRSPTGGQPVAEYFTAFAKGNSALHRLPLASEIASACLFLDSAGSSAITGQCINVDCGVLPS